MEALNERERHILTERRLKDEPVTLEELSQEYDVSRERIRQIEVRAFEKLQKRMRELAAERGHGAGGQLTAARESTHIRRKFARSCFG